MKNPFVITGFSDEIADSAQSQFENLQKLGVSYFEPRMIDGKNIIDFTDAEIDRLLSLMQTYGIRASSIGSPIGKIKPTDDLDAHFEKLKAAVHVAKRLDCRYVRMFSLFVSEEEAQELEPLVVATLTKWVDYAASQDVILLHENEKGIFGNIAPRCQRLFEQIPSDYFKAVFDFSNFVECQQDTLEAYASLKPYIAYIHIKDCKNGGGVVPAGYGDGHLKDILTDLAKSGYQGFLSLEPHLKDYTLPDETVCGENVMSFEDGNPRKFAFAHKALTDLIQDI